MLDPMNRLRNLPSFLKIVITVGSTVGMLYFQIVWLNFWKGILLTKEDMQSNLGIESILQVLPIMVTLVVTLGLIIFFFRKDNLEDD